MKLKLLLICVIFTNSHVLFAQSEKMVKSKLNEATVFFSGAELTQTANTLLQKGSNEIKISGLSPTADKNSIKIKTSNGVLVSAFDFSIDYQTTENKEIEKVEQEAKDIRKKIEILNTSIKINTELLSVMQKSVIKNVEGSEKGLGIDDLMKTMDYYKTKSLEIESALMADKDQKKKIQDDLVKVETKLNKESAENEKATGILTLNLTSAASSNCNFTITYFARSARWVPYYDINVASNNNPVKITGRAKVMQTMGMDWENVKLNLSTSQPANGKIAPLFNAWFLSFYSPQPLNLGFAKRSKDLAGASMTQNSYTYDEEIISEKIQEVTMNDHVQLNENQLNITYNIDLPYTIPGNGTEQSIELKSQEIAADLKYYSAPKLDPATYVIAEISDWEKLNLLNGIANITYDGTYVGQTNIDAASTKQKLTLTLGADKRVPVKREVLTDFSSKSVLSSGIKQSYAYQLTVRNNQNVPVKMVLKDQYPKSTQKEIEVELLLKECTTPTFNNEDVGVLSWEFELKAGESRTFKIAYSVKYPKDKTINL